MTQPGREYLTSITGNPVTAQDFHIIHVYNDPDFKSAAPKVKNDDDMKKLAEKYAIRTTDIKHYLGGYHQPNIIYKPEQAYELRPDDKGDWKAWINSDISKADFNELWEELKRHKKRKHDNKIPKTKRPIHDELLYAVFKGRLRGETFTQIYQQYMKQTLPYFVGKKPVMFSTDQDKFEEYYRKYKPTP